MEVVVVVDDVESEPVVLHEAVRATTGGGLVAMAVVVVVAATWTCFCSWSWSWLWSSWLWSSLCGCRGLGCRGRRGVDASPPKMVVGSSFYVIPPCSQSSKQFLVL